MDVRESGQQAALALLDLLPLGIVLFGAGRQILAANRSARETLERGDGLALGPDGLRTSQREMTCELRRLLDAALEAAAADQTGPVGVLALPRPAWPRPLEVVVVPLSASKAEPAAAVLLADPEQPARLSFELLHRLYGLTLTETRVASVMAQGRAIAPAAAELGLGIEAVRFHVKRLFAKTGTRRQAELVRVLLGGLAAVRLP
jgi:DNA-binding CsgD family transcriptional regulator